MYIGGTRFFNRKGSLGVISSPRIDVSESGPNKRQSEKEFVRLWKPQDKIGWPPWTGGEEKVHAENIPELFPDRKEEHKLMKQKVRGE